MQSRLDGGLTSNKRLCEITSRTTVHSKGEHSEKTSAEHLPCLWHTPPSFHTKNYWQAVPKTFTYTLSQSYQVPLLHFERWEKGEWKVFTRTWSCWDQSLVLSYTVLLLKQVVLYYIWSRFYGGWSSHRCHNSIYKCLGQCSAHMVHMTIDQPEIEAEATVCFLDSYICVCVCRTSLILGTALVIAIISTPWVINIF